MRLWTPPLLSTARRLSPPPVSRPPPTPSTAQPLLVMTARLSPPVWPLPPSLWLTLPPLMLLVTLLTPWLLVMARGRPRLMLRLLLRLRLRLVTMDTLPPPWWPLPPSAPLSPSRSVTRSPCPPPGRWPRLCARLWRTSPPSRTARRPSPLSAPRPAPRWLTAPPLLVMTPRLAPLRWSLTPPLSLSPLLPLPPWLLATLAMAWLVTEDGNKSPTP